tara:strand:- start:15551 stop:16873 length:1323 start_codon:yes stop_codon:yes gene_type:complete
MTAVKIQTNLAVKVNEPLNNCLLRVYCNGELALHSIVNRVGHGAVKVANKFTYEIVLSVDMEEDKDYNFAYFFSTTEKLDISFSGLIINDHMSIPIFPKDFVPNKNLFNPTQVTYKNVFIDIDPTLYENHVNARFLGFDTPVSADVGKSMTLRLKNGKVQVSGYFKQPDKFKRIETTVDSRAGNTQPIHSYISNLHWIIGYYKYIIEHGKFIQTNKKLQSIYNIWLDFTNIPHYEKWLKHNQTEINEQFNILLKEIEDKVDALALTKTVDMKWVTQTENSIADLEKLLEDNPKNQFAMTQLKDLQASLANLQNTVSGAYSSEHYPSVLLYDPNKEIAERVSIVTLQEEFVTLRQHGYKKVMQNWKDAGYVIYRLWDKGLFGHYKLNCPSCLDYWQDPTFENEKDMTQRVVEILSRETDEYKKFVDMVKEMHLKFMFVAER